MTLESVTAKPEDVGIDSERLEAVFERVKRDVEEGDLPSAQVAVARNGRLAGFRTFGTAVQAGETRPATNDTLYCIFSATKAVVAAAVWLLLEDGSLRLDERVAEIIPEFATNGKEIITVEQVLLHTAGFPHAPLRALEGADKRKRLEAFSRWRLNWQPDSQYEYHPTSAHWVLAEIIERRGGLDYRDFIRRRVTGPMGLDDLYVGLPDEQQHRAAEVGFVGDPVEPPGGFGEVTPQALMTLNDPAVRRAGIPGAGGFANAGQIALFYQTLVNGGTAPNGTQVLKPETIEFATRVRTKEHHVDPIWGMPANRGLSIIVAGDDGKAFMRGFGKTVSPAHSATAAPAARSPGATRRPASPSATAPTASSTGCPRAGASPPSPASPPSALSSIAAIEACPQSRRRAGNAPLAICQRACRAVPRRPGGHSYVPLSHRTDAAPFRAR